MSENNITHEMLKDELEKEYDMIEQDFIANASLQEKEYRREVFKHLNGALQVLPIPEDLLPTAHHRDILKEVYAFWVDEASSGNSVVDKPALAVDCTNKWLLDVRAEHRQSLLYDRFVEEHAAFIAAERLKTPNEIIEDAWKITCYDDLLMLVETSELEMIHVDALLTLESPLFSVYDEVLGIGSSENMDELRDTLERVAVTRVEELDHPFYHVEPGVQKYAEEFEAFYLQEDEQDDSFEQRNDNEMEME